MRNSPIPGIPFLVKYVLPPPIEHPKAMVTKGPLIEGGTYPSMIHVD